MHEKMLSYHTSLTIAYVNEYEYEYENENNFFRSDKLSRIVLVLSPEGAVLVLVIEKTRFVW